MRPSPPPSLLLTPHRSGRGGVYVHGLGGEDKTHTQFFSAAHKITAKAKGQSLYPQLLLLGGKLKKWHNSGHSGDSVHVRAALLITRTGSGTGRVSVW